MEIKNLRYFLAVAREENMSHAADILHVTQPTLSKALKALKDELGKKLFTRKSFSIKLTDEGLLLRDRAEDLCFFTELSVHQMIEIILMRRPFKQKSFTLLEKRARAGFRICQIFLLQVRKALRFQNGNFTFMFHRFSPFLCSPPPVMAVWVPQCTRLNHLSKISSCL